MPRTKTAPTTRKIDWNQHGARSREATDDLVWRPTEEGDTISGLVTKVDTANTRFGERTVVELDRGHAVVMGGEESIDGRYTLWPSSGLIDSFGDEEVDLGDMVRIELVKLIDTGRGNAFKQFVVARLAEGIGA